MKRMATALVASALVLAACGDDGEEEGRTGSAPATETTEAAETTQASEAAAQFNDADVAFVQGMIPHHQQAVEMAEMAEAQAESDSVRTLAARIAEAQGPEIQTMEGWLREWGVEQADDGGGMAGMDHGSSEGMGGGMMSGDDMAALEAASGSAFDEMFLAMMIEHHEGAVDMARDEVEQGLNEDAVSLAERIISAQEAEIAEMRDLLETAE